MSTQSSNISIASNIWINAEAPLDPLKNNVHAAAKAMPGDLAFKIIIPHTDPMLINRAVLEGTITRRQVNEREFFRHFAPHNHLGNPRIVDKFASSLTSPPSPILESPSPWLIHEESSMKNR